MKLSDWLPSVFVEGDGDDIQVITKKFSQFPSASGEGIQGVGIKDGSNVRFELTTDSIKVNPEPFRNARGQFVGTPEELADLENQRDVNNFLYQAINDIEAGDIDIPPGTIVSEDPPEDVEEGQCWYDTVRLELFVFAEDAWLPCSPLGARVEAGEVLQAEIVKQIQQSISDQEVLEEKIEAGEKEQEELKGKVAALEGSVGHHRLTFALRLGVRPGEFTLLDSQGAVVNTLSGAASIVLSDTDTEGSPIQIGRIEPNDIIRLVSVVDSNEGAELRVISDENDVFEFIQISGTADRLAEDLPYAFTLLSSFDPEGLATIDYVDSRVDTKLEVTGDKMSGALDMQDNHVSNVKAPATDGDAANRKYVDESIEAGIAGGNFAKKDDSNTWTGVQTLKKISYFENAVIHNSKNADTLTEVRGDNEDGTKQLWHKIRGTNRVSWICYPGQENRDYKKCMEMEWDAEAGRPLVRLDYLQTPTGGSQAVPKKYVDSEVAGRLSLSEANEVTSSFRIKVDGGTYISTSGGELGLYHVKYPEAEGHAATKQYVDDEVAKAGGGSFAETGSTTPSLSSGQLFYNTTDKVLYIGE